MATSRETRFSLDVVRAGKGDCLILHFGTARKPGILLIDGGPAGVYRSQLRPRLVGIRNARELPYDQPLPIDALLVSHIDDDHIRGILDLTGELRTQIGDRSPLLVQVNRLWHNSFDDLLDTTPEQLRTESAFGLAALAGEVPLDGTVDHDVAKVLASIDQGRTLRDDAELLQWPVNAPFGGLITTNTAGPNRRRPARVALGNLRITVVGPRREELKALQAAHDAHLRRQNRDADTIPAAFRDRSISNLSSIVLLVEAGGRRVLLTGDARGDKIVAGLESSGVIKNSQRSRLHVDVLKVPHHGSANNVEPSFFERVTADHYVFSGDGKHGNPERETLEMLFAARRDAPFTLHFTYPLGEIDAARQTEWDQAHQADRRRGETSRPAWSPAIHGLERFFETTALAPGQSIAIAADRAPHLIELLAPV